ncbi:Histone-lysine N-methyltransferase ASHR1 [Pseudolycoriella hygida]|uniref:Histone-lysine N-methyltransferase ASHR1 n=1 Tax=Pseudolycoriella hygida TaxID=35572 RepID=A0A9Q0S7S4_9DIPT|nr:Histone-lysine N-methyltransferase ASHR1 [Pseudolycoriella hygida]
MKSVTVTRLSLQKLDIPNGQSISQDLRVRGDSFFENGYLFEALECYNKSLCVAQTNSDILSAYECRSIVYLKAEEYKLCLDNIELACKYCDNASERLTILDERKKACLKLMRFDRPNCDSEPWNFFRLSYDANEKLPFIVDCLKLHNNKKFGRSIITTQDLQPGDIIAIDEPFFKTVTYESAHTRCINCLKPNKLNLMPSTISETAMFCSEECMEIASKTYADTTNKMHDIKQRMLFEALVICGGSFSKLKELMDASDLKKETIFSYDLSNPDDPLFKQNLLKSSMSLAQAKNVSADVINYLSHHPVLETIKDQRDKEIAETFLLRCFRILAVNSFGIEWLVPSRPQDHTKDTIVTKRAGQALCLFGSLMNHSCIPNVDRVFVQNKFVFFVRRPIFKGQQLFISYGSLFLDMPREIRQQNLKDEYGFWCCCEACVRDYPTSAVYPWTGVPIVISELSVANGWKDEFKKNCLKIVKKQNVWSQAELCLLMVRNLYLVTAIAKTEPFIF